VKSYNQNMWAIGKSVAIEAIPETTTRFERAAERLGLTTMSQMIGSKSLRNWCAQHRLWCFIPEDILTAFGIIVKESEILFTGDTRSDLPVRKLRAS
jgi:hypothetical protein